MGKTGSGERDSFRRSDKNDANSREGLERPQAV
jgi:hypothetical protein